MMSADVVGDMDPNMSFTINTFVFLDLETSALYRMDKPKIMELSLAAVHRNALCQSGNVSSQLVPRVLDKITLCFNPNKQVEPKSFELTGLDNFNIVDSAKEIFDDDAVKLMQLFLRRQEQPVCLVAHNGNNFDFQLLRTELNKINQSLGDDILCADSLIGFYETDMEENKGSDTSSTDGKSSVAEVNNTTPAKRARLDETPSTPSKQPGRSMPYDAKTTQSYSLASVYKRTFGQDLPQAHSAEGDVLGLIKICKARGQKICQWMDKNAMRLSDIQLYYMPSPPRSSQRSLRFWGVLENAISIWSW